MVYAFFGASDFAGISTSYMTSLRGMGFPTKVQCISRKASEQWYVAFPSALAQAVELSKGESVQWIVADKGHFILARDQTPPNPVDVEKKTRGH